DEVHVRACGRGEGVEAGDGERRGELARAVGAEVKEDDGVAVSERRYRVARFTHADDWFDELVGHAALVRASDRRDRIVGLLAFAVNQQLIGALCALPTLVAIHRVVAPADRGDLADADLSALVAHRRDVTNGRR